MKNSFFLVSILFLISCNNVEQYRAGIEGLSSSWQSATQSVTDLSNQIQGEISAHSTAMSAVALPANFAKLKPEVQTGINDAMAACNSSSAGFTNILNEVNTFAAEWTAKGADVTALTEGLTAGKLGSDTATKIADLTAYATEAGTKVSGWAQALATVKAATGEKHAALLNMIAAATAKK